MKSLLFVFFIVSFLFGVFINNILEKIDLSLIVLLLLTILFLNFLVYYKKLLKVFLSIIIGLLIGIFFSSYNLKIVVDNKNFIDNYIDIKGQEYILEIDSINSISEYNTKYIVNLLEINSVKNRKNIKGQISLANNYKLKKGYIIKVNSFMSKIDNFGNFDYKNYMISRGIYFKMNVYKLNILDKGKTPIFYSKIANIRKSMLSIIDKLYTKDEAIFLGGILLGARESMSKELKNNFNNSGLTHFIAVSGFNITILIVFFSFLLKFFPIFIRITFISFFIFVFVILVGDTAPVIRASIMGLLAYYILLSGRKVDVWILILFTTFLMVLFNSLIINYDISFQLSFLAVIGIVFTKDYFDKIFYFLPNILAVRESFVLTISAMVFTLPIMLFDFGQFSLLAPISNILVSWTIAIAMLFGFLSVIFYYLHPLLGYFIAYFDWLLLRYDIYIVKLFGNAEFAIFRYDFGHLINYIKILYFIIVSFIVLYFRDFGEKEVKENLKN